MSRERLCILSQANLHAPLHTPHDCNDTQSVHSATAACTTSKPPKSDRARHPEHYCAFEECCYKFYDEGGLPAKDIEHLPVCHSYCWKLERERLMRDERGEGGGPRELFMNLRICHRQCYMESVLNARNSEREGKRVVPANRSIGERLRIPMLEHRFELKPRSTKLERYMERLLAGAV